MLQLPKNQSAETRANHMHNRSCTTGKITGKLEVFMKKAKMAINYCIEAMQKAMKIEHSATKTLNICLFAY
jgi:hypothetical protein